MKLVAAVAGFPSISMRSYYASRGVSSGRGVLDPQPLHSDDRWASHAGTHFGQTLDQAEVLKFFSDLGRCPSVSMERATSSPSSATVAACVDRTSSSCRSPAVAITRRTSTSCGLLLDGWEPTPARFLEGELPVNSQEVSARAPGQVGPAALGAAELFRLRHGRVRDVLRLENRLDRRWRRSRAATAAARRRGPHGHRRGEQAVGSRGCVGDALLPQASRRRRRQRARRPRSR